MISRACDDVCGGDECALEVVSSGDGDGQQVMII